MLNAHFLCLSSGDEVDLTAGSSAQTTDVVEVGLFGFPAFKEQNATSDGPIGRARWRQSADTPSPSLLKHLLKGESGGAAVWPSRRRLLEYWPIHCSNPPSTSSDSLSSLKTDHDKGRLSYELTCQPLLWHTRHDPALHLQGVAEPAGLHRLQSPQGSHVPGARSQPFTAFR